MMETLKKLGDGDRPIRIFDIQARQDLSGNFQIGAAQKGTTARFRSPLQRVGQPRNVPVLEAGAPQQVKFWTAVRKMTLNPDLYGVHRAAVVAKLKADAADYVAELEIV